MSLHIFISGASGEIGSAAALKLAGPDRKLFLVGHRNAAALQALSDRLAEAGCLTEAMLADLSAPEGCAQTSQLTIQGALGMANVTCTCNVVGQQMYMLFDADKLLGIASSVASASSTTSSLSSLLSNYSGLKLGWAMQK